MGKIKITSLIFTLVFLAFANSLTNGLIGDDKSIFVDNQFYRTFTNFGKLLQPEFVMRPGETPHELVDRISISGFVSYRPVVAATFFLDSLFWKDKPFGYHLDNLLLHILVVGLLYCLVQRLTANNALALLAALLFGTHPIQSEAVNTIGYRSDILLAIFYLWGFWEYLRWKKEGAGGIPWRTLIAFFLALFCKETALTFPLVLLLYDYLFAQRGNRPFPRAPVLGGFCAVAIFYLVVYLLVMPNAYYPRFPHQDLSGWAHAAVSTKIFVQYLTALVWPLAVPVLPPLYAPAPQSVLIFEILAAVSALVFSAAAFRKFHKTKPLVTFALGWFWFTYLPVSNLVPLLNPMAFRFLYLPSVGVFILVALAVQSAADFVQKKSPSPKMGIILKASVIGFYICCTFPLNEYFKNDIVACKEMTRRFPDSSRPYWILGLNYLERAELSKARNYFETYLNTPVRNSFITAPQNDFLVYHMLGRSALEHPDEAMVYFQRAIELNPDYPLPYVDMAKAYILKGDYPAAIEKSRAAIRLNPRLVLAHVYLIHSQVMLGQLDAAGQMLSETRQWAGTDKNLDYLEQLIRARRTKHE